MMYEGIKAISLLVYPLGFFFVLALAGFAGFPLGRRRLGGVLMFWGRLAVGLVDAGHFRSAATCA